jgi:hypothetical protein
LSEGESALISRRDDLDSLTAEFVEASIKAEHDERYLKLRNSRRIAAGFAGLAFVAVAMLGLTLWKESEIVRSAERANRGFGIAMQAAATLAG